MPHFWSSSKNVDRRSPPGYKFIFFRPLYRMGICPPLPWYRKICPTGNCLRDGSPNRIWKPCYCSQSEFGFIFESYRRYHGNDAGRIRFKLLVSHSCGNYYHWLLNHLPRWFSWNCLCVFSYWMFYFQ